MTSSTPPSGLYLRLSADTDPQRALQFIQQVAFVVNRSNYDKNMHVFEITPAQAEAEYLQTLIRLIQERGLVAIINGDAEQAKELGADGALLNDITKAEAARTLLGDEGIIGIGCDLGRAEAATLINRDIDYIILGRAHASPLMELDLLKWWSASSEIACVAAGPVTNDDAKRLVSAGATFLDCTDYVWSHEKGTIQAVVNMLYAIDLAAEPNVSAAASSH